jgi:hypothetical protein
MRAGRRFGIIAAVGLTIVGCRDSKPAPAPPAQQGPWTITAGAGAGGSISPSGAVSVAHGASQSFTIAASPGFMVSGVTVDGASVGAVASYTFSNVTAAHSIDATFVAAFTITASAGPGGTIAPSGAVTVAEGGSQTFTVTANQGFIVSSVTVDGVSQGAVAEFTFSSVTADHTIAATFAAQPTSVVVRLVTQAQGTPPLIGGVQATLTYATDKGLSIAAGNVAASGAGAGSLLVANASTAGQVIVALVNANGIAAGEFATATFAVAPPNLPVAADFAVAPGATVIALDGTPIPGVTVTVAPPDVL